MWLMIWIHQIYYCACSTDETFSWNSETNVSEFQENREEICIVTGSKSMDSEEMIVSIFTTGYTLEFLLWTGH